MKKSKNVHLMIDRNMLAHCRDLMIQVSGERPIERNGSESWSQVIKYGLGLALSRLYGGNWEHYPPSRESIMAVNREKAKTSPEEDLFRQKAMGQTVYQPGMAEPIGAPTAKAFDKPFDEENETFFFEEPEKKESDRIQIPENFLSQLRDTNLMGWENRINVLNSGNISLKDYLETAREKFLNPELSSHKKAYITVLAAIWILGKEEEKDLLTEEDKKNFEKFWIREDNNQVLRATPENPCYEDQKSKIKSWKEE